MTETAAVIDPKRGRQTPQERQARIDQIRERKTSLAQERDSVVTMAVTLDSRILLDIQRSLDINMNILRKRMGLDPRYSSDMVTNLIARIHGSFRTLDELNKELCKLTGRPYRAPRLFRDVKQDNGSGNGKAEDAVIATAPTSETENTVEAQTEGETEKAAEHAETEKSRSRKAKQ